MSWPKQQTPRNRSSAAGERVRSAAGRPEKPKVARQANIPPRRTWLTFLILLLINYLLMRFLFPGPGKPVTTPIPPSRRRL
jgi:cell division protease FtsH